LPEDFAVLSIEQQTAINRFIVACKLGDIDQVKTHQSKLFFINEKCNS
jgi:hypothetical protein